MASPAHAEVEPAQGVAVVLLPPADLWSLDREKHEEAASALAHDVYARDALRPAHMTESLARGLVGRGSDALARRLRQTLSPSDTDGTEALHDLASALSVRAVVVVGAGPSARLYLSDINTFEPSRYMIDASGRFGPLVLIAERQLSTLGGGTSRSSAKSEAAKPKDAKEGRPFYASPWFWGAAAGALFVGAAIYLLGRDKSDGTIHLQMNVPR